MPLYHIVILALIQGITEFLPISSSGHLVLAHNMLNHTDSYADLTFDIAVHVGTLFAVMLYFRKDVMRLFRASLHCLTRDKSKTGDKDTRLLLHLFIASLPVILAGFLVHQLQPEGLRSLPVLAWCTLIFALVLWVSDKYGATVRTLDNLSIKGALFIGVAQVLALIPGTSRSGITMSAARWLGISRTESARFSLLLAMVAISGAGTLSGIDLLQSGNLSLGFDTFLAVILSFFASWVAIILLMKWLTRSSFTPFVLYRLIIGTVLLLLIYSGNI